MFSLLASLSLLTPSASAACTVSALRPATGSTIMGPRNFTFLMSPDCTSSTFTIPSVESRTPTFVRMVAGQQLMVVHASAADWAAWAPASNPTLTYTVTAEGASGLPTSQIAVLELDLDADGYTRNGGDCDDSHAAVYPHDIDGDGTDDFCAFRDLDAGFDHTCGILDRTGELVCWGSDDKNESSPPSGSFIAVSAGHEFGCAINTSGSVQCWGLHGSTDNYGQASPPSGTFTSVSAGVYHACGIDPGGSVRCWGYSFAGETTPPATTFTSVSAGLLSTCGLTTSGTIECWGWGYGATASAGTPPPTGVFSSVQVGYGYSCALSTSGTVQCWGWDDLGQSTPPSTTFAAIEVGDYHACGHLDTGAVECWGYDEFGQATAPTDAFLDITAGQMHTCGIDVTETVQCWGLDTYGQASPP